MCSICIIDKLAHVFPAYHKHILLIDVGERHQATVLVALQNHPFMSKYLLAGKPPTSIVSGWP